PLALAVRASRPLRSESAFPRRRGRPLATHHLQGWGISVKRRRIGIALNGVTGRMGYRQHLVRSLLAIREEGGLPLPDGRRLWPEPILVGRKEQKLLEIAERHGITEWTTD